MTPCWCENCSRKFDIDEPAKEDKVDKWYCKECGRPLQNTGKRRDNNTRIFICSEHGVANIMCATGLHACPYCCSTNVHSLCNYSSCDYDSCRNFSKE